MSTHPPFRPLLVALALVVALAGLALTLLAAPYARLAGALPALLQHAANAPGESVAWIETGADGVSRAELAAIVEALGRAGVRVTVLAVPLEQAETNADLARVRSFLDGDATAGDPALRARLQEWAAELDRDTRLEQALRAAGNVVLLARPRDPSSAGATAAASTLPPLARFARAARAVGVEPAAPADADGVRRRDALLIDDDAGALRRAGVLAVADARAPGLAFAAWLAARGASTSELEWAGAGARVAGETVRAGERSEWLPAYGRRAGVAGGPLRVTAAELLEGSVPAGLLTARMAVVGPSSPVGRYTTGPLPEVEALALRLASLERGDGVRAAPLGGVAVLVVLALVVLWAGGIAPRLEAVPRAGATLGLALGLVALEVVLLAQAGTWLPLAGAALALLVATAVAGLFAGDGEPAAATARASSPPAARTPPAAARATTPRAAPPRARDAPVAPAATPATLRELSDSLRARDEARSRADVADLLLGRARRAPKPRLGRYELEREIGRGATGTVYLGRDPRINRVVALKAVPLAEEFEGRELAEARTRFLREAELAGQLQHPGIVTVYDAGEDGAIAYIAMEYVQGRLLDHHATSDRLLPPAQVLEIAARVADALDYAHARGIVHRDVKPSNLIFDPATLGTKIMDFGIARLSSAGVTRTGIVLGTPSFMAPEQLEGRIVTGRSDLFSLGVTLFQLLAGQLPFRADSMTGLMDRIANAPHPPLRTIRPDLPPCVGLIVDRALQKDPSARYATAAEMARALRACARSLSA